jgi:hypothetical protein
MIARFQGLEIQLLAELFNRIPFARRLIGTLIRRSCPRLWQIYSPDCPNDFETSSYNHGASGLSEKAGASDWQVVISKW